MPTNLVYFLSDAHFHRIVSPKEVRKRELFVRFLKSLQDVSHLYLLGDLFDFWFDFRTVIPRYYLDILVALKNVADRGIDVGILGGNHDYWLRSFFEKEMGFRYFDSPALVRHHDRRILLHHGDGLLPGDYGYKIMKSVIRNRAFIGLLKLLHPDLVNTLAFKFSRTSRGTRKDPLRQIEPFTGQRVFDRYFHHDNDAFVMGHIHIPMHRRSEGRDFVILGDWEDYFSFLRLENGSFHLECLPEGRPIPKPPGV